MKMMLITVVLASLLVLGVKAQTNLGDACTLAGTDPCIAVTGANSECRMNSAATPVTQCFCKARYQQATTTTCLLLGGEVCTLATQCASGACTDGRCDGKSAENTACRENGECKSLNCYRDTSAHTDKCSGTGTITASLVLMLLALVSSRFF